MSGAVPSPVSALRGLLDGHERFFITGASGWFGRVTLDLLAEVLGPRRFAESVVGFARTEKECDVAQIGSLRLRPIAAMTEVDPPSHLLHYAYVTKDRIREIGEAEFCRQSATLTDQVVLAMRAWQPRGLLFTSSGAGVDGDETAYGMFKRIDELCLRQACRDLGATSVVARVWSVVGPHALVNPKPYALTDFIAQALDGGPIRVRSRVPVVRSYAVIRDVIAVGLAELLSSPARSDVTYESGGEILDLRDLAERINRIVQPADPRVLAEIDPDGEASRYASGGADIDERRIKYGLPATSLDDALRELVAEMRGLRPA